MATLCLAASLSSLHAQSAELQEAEANYLPGHTDGNSPLFWFEGRLHVFTSIGWPLRLSRADDQFGPWETVRVDTRDFHGKSLWVESVSVDDDDVLTAWYHHEPGNMHEGSMLTAPKIGAAVSFDGGATLLDLGIVLESGDAPNGEAENGFFTGGHGDFTTVIDRERRYVYFFFTNYGGADETHGVCAARMAYADRFAPKGKVFKFHNNEWNSPGIGGPVTPIFAAPRSWRHADPEGFWGPAVHWNSHLRCFTMLLNFASGSPGWSQQGVYISFSNDLTKPHAWKKPHRLLGPENVPGWSSFYPQAIGVFDGETDSSLGRIGRFYLNGLSNWRIEFSRLNPPEPAEEQPPKPLDGDPSRS